MPKLPTESEVDQALPELKCISDSRHYRAGRGARFLGARVYRLESAFAEKD